MTDVTTAPAPVAPTSAPRSRVRTSWLMLAAAMFLLTAIVVWWGISTASDRTQALVVVSDVPAGEVLTAEAIGTTSVSLDDGFGRVYTEDQLEAIVGAVAAVDLSAGDLLGPTVLASAPDTLAGERLVGAVLRAGRYPIEIGQGDLGFAVRILDRTEGVVPESAPIRVVSVSISETDEASVTLAVPVDQAAAVGAWAGKDELVLVVEPLGAPDDGEAPDVPEPVDEPADEEPVTDEVPSDDGEDGS